MSVFDIDDPAKFRQYLLGSLSKGVFKGERLKSAKEFILDAWGNNCQWAQEYLWILVMPRFLNIASAAGCCNCDCRMCTNARDGDLQFLTRDAFVRLLDNAPTAQGVTFSAANSDPLMNPEFGLILEELSNRAMSCDFYTNAIALSTKMSDSIIASNAVGMINFSLDAASAKTYKQIRRREFDVVSKNIRYFAQRAKQEQGAVPLLSVSMVEMEDNIAELQDLVVFAASVGAGRVVVQALLGDVSTQSRSALFNPAWKQYVSGAQMAAAQLGVQLDLPQKFLSEMGPQVSGGKTDNACVAKGQKPQPVYACCSWIDGVWIELNGQMRACCMNPAQDLGNLFEGKLWENKKFLDAKLKLLEGKVFASCLHYTSQCPYLQDLLRTGNKPTDYICS